MRVIAIGFMEYAFVKPFGHKLLLAYGKHYSLPLRCMSRKGRRQMQDNTALMFVQAKMLKA